MNANIQRAREILVAAVAKMAPEQWDAYLAEVRAEDDELLGWVKQLLGAHAEGAVCLKPPLRLQSPRLKLVDRAPGLPHRSGGTPG
jgi:hypothetical protein